MAGAHTAEIEIANEHGEAAAAVLNTSEVVLAKGGQLQVFTDDVTKSAPSSLLNATKSGARLDQGPIFALHAIGGGDQPEETFFPGAGQIVA